ncbi:MAG: patatin-like phospholipase family protein [Bacillota bacterium]
MHNIDKLRSRPLVGLALGGGGARGYAHLGVLKALCRAGIPVDIIAGTSMGAVVGAVYAAGHEVEEMQAIALSMYWQDMLQLADITFPRRGVIAGGRLEHFFAMLTGNKEFHELRTILKVVATDIVAGKEVRLTTGSVARALRASTALPGIFCPVRIDNLILADGSLVAPVPAAAVMEMDPLVLIVVDVSSPVDNAGILLKTSQWFRCKFQSSATQSKLWRPLSRVVPESLILVNRSLELCSKGSLSREYPVPAGGITIVVRPAVQEIKWYELHQASKCIKAGETAGTKVAEYLVSLYESNVFTGERMLNPMSGNEVLIL